MHLDRVSQRPDEIFTPKADRMAREQDIVICYQIFLGRDPESRSVIEGAKRQAVRELILRLLASEEFAKQVARPLARGEQLPHNKNRRPPTRVQISWLIGHIRVGDKGRFGNSWGWANVLSEVARTISDVASVSYEADSTEASPDVAGGVQGLQAPPGRKHHSEEAVRVRGDPDQA